ncbi:MAG: methyltransferase domain-containing protein [bacterium]|nr:methyltransferase domain-containing protein [bacterium]
MNTFLHSQNPNIKPLEFIEKVLSFCDTGNALDLGAGTGRNAIFLAKKGFKVVALDLSGQSVDELTQYSAREGLSLKTFVYNLATNTPDFSNYNIILFTFILHYISKERGEELIATAQKQANTGTIHALAVITTEGDFFAKETQKKNFYLEPGNLAKKYEKEGWTVLSSFEENRAMAIKNADGTQMKNLVSFLIARK